MWPGVAALARTQTGLANQFLTGLASRSLEFAFPAAHPGRPPPRQVHPGGAFRCRVYHTNAKAFARPLTGNSVSLLGRPSDPASFLAYLPRHSSGGAFLCDSPLIDQGRRLAGV